MPGTVELSRELGSKPLIRSLVFTVLAVSFFHLATESKIIHGLHFTMKMFQYFMHTTLTMCNVFETIDCLMIPLTAVEWMNWLNVCQKAFNGLVSANSTG